jgi:putative NADH-flavin reductase
MCTGSRTCYDIAMHIAVIAANGRTGKAFVREALAAGHRIRAGVFHGNDLPQHERLEVVPCDATDRQQLMRLVQGTDAVVSLIGHVKGSPARVQTEAMQALVSVMADLGTKRLVSLTGTGVRFPGDRITLIDRILNLAVGIVDPARVSDGREHVRVLQATDLDWTVIRVLKLQNVAARAFKLSANGPTKWYVGRREVAQAILQVLDQHSFVRQAPILCRA